jgi:hypothetical protein
MTGHNLQVPEELIEECRRFYGLDGGDLWHRVDTKAAKVIRRTAKRQVVGRG